MTFLATWFLGRSVKFQAILAAIGGAVLAFMVFMTWNTLWDNPRVRDEAEAKLTANFHKAIGELGNEADNARARRRLCVSTNGMWNFETGECRQD